MTNNQEKLHSCTHYIVQPCNLDNEKCNTLSNSDATISLKASAKLLLQRNWQCNSVATRDKNQCNFAAWEIDKKLQDNLILKYGVSIQELELFLGKDWDDYKNNPVSLELWAELLFKNRLIEQGKIPDNFNAVTWCASCGYVHVPPALVNGGSVLGCPWCWNRAKDLPIPTTNGP